ncbi:MAG: hypothetical protein ACLQVK_24280 [Acidimicrobiales bacterium]
MGPLLGATGACIPLRRVRQRERVRPTTWEQYRGAVGSWVLPYLGAVNVTALTPKLVVDWQAQLRSERHLWARSL